jgi:sugar/nucleoside kinase (ribokinase family)
VTTTPSGPAAEYDVLVIGGAGVDTIVRVDAFAFPEGDSVSVPPVHDYVGHTGNGVALGCHALGLATKFVDFLGEDAQGRMVLEAYAERGLDFSHVVSPHGTPRGVNLVDAQGRRFSFYDGRHPADLRLPRSFYLPFVERARHAHLSVTGHNRDVYADLERLGVPSSTDLHDWDGVAEHHLYYALRSDLVFLSAAAVRGRVGEVMRGVLERGRAGVIVATDGAEGCHVLERGWEEPRHVPAADPGAPVVDTNGAGDAFVAAFLHACLEGAPSLECARAGAVAGAFACTTAGTHADFIGPSALRGLTGDRAQ